MIQYLQTLNKATHSYEAGIWGRPNSSTKTPSCNERM